MSTVRLLAVGDICLKAPGHENPFGKVLPMLGDKDILFGNLETVLSDGGESVEKEVVLCEPPPKAAYLKDAGFDVLSLANNHVMDLGAEGLRSTLAALRECGLQFVGATDGESADRVVIEKNGIGVGFLAYSEWAADLPEERVRVNGIDLDVVRQDIASISSECDLVVISLHWGMERVYYPSPEQIGFARKLIDDGASVVLGHHPHVLQGIEVFRRGIIAYSLGNFQFYCKKDYRSMALCLQFDKEKLLDHRVLPLSIGAGYRPAVDESAGSLDLLNRISQPLEHDTVTERWWFEQVGAEYLVSGLRGRAVMIKRHGPRYLLRLARWLIQPFTLRCCAGLFRAILKRLLDRT